MILTNLIPTFALPLTKQFPKLFANNIDSDINNFKIIYLSGLHFCSTLGRFSLLKGFVTNRSFYSICIIKYLLQTANATHHIKDHLIELIKKFPNTPIQFMGIPSNDDATLFNWQNEPLWN